MISASNFCSRAMPRSARRCTSSILKWGFCNRFLYRWHRNQFLCRWHRRWHRRRQACLLYHSFTTTVFWPKKPTKTILYGSCVGPPLYVLVACIFPLCLGGGSTSADVSRKITSAKNISIFSNWRYICDSIFTRMAAEQKKSQETWPTEEDFNQHSKILK